jgi:hypothetical protein
LNIGCPNAEQHPSTIGSTSKNAGPHTSRQREDPLLTDSVQWIASYPRSGNTWLRFLVVNCLVDHQFDWETAMNCFAFELYYYLSKMRTDGWTEHQTLEVLRSVVRNQPTREHIGDRVYLKTHNAWTPEHPFGRYADRALLIVRDPRDVLLSAVNFHKLTRDADADPVAYAHRYIEHGSDPAWINAGYGTWYDHYRSWTAQADFPVHVVRYETLKTDPVPALLQLCDFLGFEVSQADAERAVERTALAKLQDVERKARADGSFGGLNEGYQFFNTGQSGQSLDDLEPGLDDLFEQKFASGLAELGYARSARS